jgi:hypothetical protein
MNFKEGMRRVGLVLGICGAVVGGFFAFMTVAPAWTEYQETLQFEHQLQTRIIREIVEAIQKDKETAGKIIQLKMDGVEKVHVDKSGEIITIELMNGKELNRRSRKISLVELLGTATILPSVGFLVPWATIRLLMWIVGGFTKK